MRKNSITRIFGSVTLAGALFVISLFPSTSSATVVALTENSNGFLVSGSGLNAAFIGFDTATFADTQNTFFSGNTAADNAKQGASFSTASVANIILFDLSSIPSGATIDSAQLQLHAAGGNSGAGSSDFGRITTQAWTDALASTFSPIGTISTPEWGAGSDAKFTLAGDAPSAAAGSFDTVAPIGASFLIEDVTADITSFVTGTDNFGWAFKAGNRTVQSTSSDDGNRPVLYIEYTISAVPEPNTVVLMGLAALVGLAFAGRRSRK